MRKCIQIILVLIFILVQGKSPYASALNSCLAPNIQINDSLLYDLFSFYSFPAANSLNADIITADDSLNTKKILIKVEDYKDEIEIISFDQNKAYGNWIVKQYEERTLFNYPYIATKVMINTMIAQKNVFKDAIVLDAGSGDGIAAILSEKLGAKKVYCIEWEKGVIGIAENNAALNSSRRIEFINGDFKSKLVEIKDAPTVLLLNVGYINQDIEIILNNYPTIKYIFLTSQNQHSEIYGQNFLSDFNSVNSLGKITKAFYHSQGIYAMNAFDEAYWGFAIERSDPEAEIEFAKRQDVIIMEDVSIKQISIADNSNQYILNKLKEKQGISVTSQLESGKNSDVYIAKHPKFGKVILKIVPYEIDSYYGVEERFEISSFFSQEYGRLSPFPRALEFISFEPIGSAVLVEEYIEDFTRREFLEILEKHNGVEGFEAERILQYLELQSLVKIWLKSFQLSKYQGLVIRDIMPQDIRYLKINGNWAAKFIDLEERGFFPKLKDFVSFYSEWENGYDQGMLAEIVLNSRNLLSTENTQERIDYLRKIVNNTIILDNCIINKIPGLEYPLNNPVYLAI